MYYRTKERTAPYLHAVDVVFLFLKRIVLPQIIFLLGHTYMCHAWADSIWRRNAAGVCLNCKALDPGDLAMATVGERALASFGHWIHLASKSFPTSSSPRPGFAIVTPENSAACQHAPEGFAKSYNNLSLKLTVQSENGV